MNIKDDEEHDDDIIMIMMMMMMMVILKWSESVTLALAFLSDASFSLCFPSDFG